MKKITLLSLLLGAVLLCAGCTAMARVDRMPAAVAALACVSAPETTPAPETPAAEPAAAPPADPVTVTKEYANFEVTHLLPYNHYAGKGEYRKYMAVILFEYEMDNYTKYQVTYMGCDERKASENYQHLLYVEINNNAPSAEEATIRNIEYQLWGDTEPNPENGLAYADFQKEWLPYLQYKTKAQLDAVISLKGLTDVPAVERGGKEAAFVDAYSGATVSINNSLAVLHALMDYHAAKYYA